ncbi:hypothetical protein FDECE_11214 [Fusarium decemcellulare]|nr:hypothetical protein FDECE_11214 [Fusarium decemcellulare]
MQHKTYTARTSEDLRALSKQYGDIQVISQLGPKELTNSASTWNVRHLITYRLLVRPEETLLPVFKANHDDMCPVCKPDQLCPQQELNHSWTGALTGEIPSKLYLKTECELLQLPDGFFWIALARAARPDLADQARVYPQRERKQIKRESYISSTSAITGSSSPMRYSSSEFEADMNDDVDEDEHEARRSKPEEVTVHLITCFLQHALNLCLLQHSADEMASAEVRPRIERRTTNTRVAGELVVTAEDDGGICRMRRLKHGWGMDHPYLALLEAKRAFKYIHFDEKTERYNPIVSNENLAQYLGEAVITWKENQKLLHDNVFLIAATNTFVRFVHFRFGRDYLEYLNATDERAQMEIVNDEEKEAFVYMQTSKWFNLQSSDGRRIALCHVLALLRWHDTRDSLRSQADGHSIEDDSDRNHSVESEEEDYQGHNEDSMDIEE